MNILYIEHYAGSLYHGNSQRPYYLGQEWLKDGHKLTVVSASYSHVRHTQPQDTGLEVIDGIDYMWLPCPRYQGNGFMRIISMFVFTLQLFVHMYGIIKQSKPDVVVASTRYMFDVIPAWAIAKITKSQLVYELHDLWPMSPMQLGGHSPYHPFILLLRGMEWMTHKLSDRVISCLPNTYEHIRQFGVSEDRFHYIPNGVYLPDWDETADLPADLEEKLSTLKKDGYFIVGYTGAHSVANTMHVLLDAAAQLQNEKIHFVLIGDGQEKEKLIKKADYLKLKNITFYPKILKRAVPNALSHMDLLYIGWQNLDLYKYGTSAQKVFDYMMSGKPVLQGMSTGTDFITQAGCGLTVEAENPGTVVDGIRTMMKKSPQDLQAMGKKGINYVKSHHDYKILAQQFIDAIA